MKKLLELEEKLRKAKEDLKKGTWLGGTQTSTQSGGVTQGTSGSGSGSGPSIADQIGWGKSEVEKKEDKKEKKEDEKEDKKIVAEAVDQHNEKKHGEAKDKDSAFKDMKVEKGCNSEMIKFEKNGQWSLKKSMPLKPDGKYDVPVKEVYDGDDKFKERGGKSVDGDKGKTIKVADKEAKDLKSL